MLLVPLALAQDVVIREPLRTGSSATTVYGGTFTGDGWRVDDSSSRMFWDLGRQVNRGTISVTIDDVDLADLTGDNNHLIELFDEGGHWDCHRAINLRVYGSDNPDDQGDIKLKVWDEVGYAEARGGIQDWDGGPHTWTITWDETSAVLFRDGAEVVSLDVSGLDLSMGSLWLPLNEWNGGYSAPIGAVYSSLDFVAWAPGEDTDPVPPDDGDPDTYLPLEDVGATAYDAGVYGDEDDLPAEGSTEMSYLMYDLSAVRGTVTRATLRLNVRSDGSSGGSGASVWSVRDTSWDEDSLTWATRPSPVAELASFGALSAGESVEVDVTDGVAAGGLVALAILSDGTDGLHLASKEYGDGGDAAVLSIVTREGGESDADTDGDADTDADADADGDADENGGDTGSYDDWEPRTPRDRDEADAEEGGCGCDAGATGAGWLAVAAAFAMRRRR